VAYFWRSKVKYAICDDYKIDWLINETKIEEIYSCYIDDEFGNRICAIRKAADLKNISIDKPAKRKSQVRIKSDRHRALFRTCNKVLRLKESCDSFASITISHCKITCY
jgi:hypothetical protein